MTGHLLVRVLSICIDSVTGITEHRRPETRRYVVTVCTANGRRCRDGAFAFACVLYVYISSNTPSHLVRPVTSTDYKDYINVQARWSWYSISLPTCI